MFYVLDEKGDARPSDIMEWGEWYSGASGDDLLIGRHQIVWDRRKKKMSVILARQEKSRDMEVLSTIETRYLLPQEQQRFGVVGLPWRIYSIDTDGNEESTFTARRKAAEAAHMARIYMLVDIHTKRRS
jgi:hypothetical protein